MEIFLTNLGIMVYFNYYENKITRGEIRMKKKIIIVSILIILIIVLLVIPRDVYKKIFGRDDVVVETPVNKVYQNMFLKDASGKLIGVDVEVPCLEEDVTMQKWNLLTKDVSTLPVGYTSPIAQATELIEYETLETVLYLHVSEAFLESEGRITIECLAWNFCNDEVSEVVVKIDGIPVSNLNNYYFKTIKREIGVNLTFETAFLYEASHVTVIEYEDNKIKPVTYFYETGNDYEYLVNKILGEKWEAKVNYTYEATTDSLVINLLEEANYDEDTLKTLTASIKFNFDVDSFILNGTDAVILEHSFETVDNV